MHCAKDWEEELLILFSARKAISIQIRCDQF